ncbi:uncharacterized protein LOC131317616 isoform X1 [Rhododendron vialii]|uniref:uncharacterized protein LOC131317616 isoform X1 n=1 Tax=Rhododendron vialii TaxID=182163 RepID=UPI00265E8EE5|nr:uncharacterized protein LOC131317616 isoform X1 [Rhododendron vialii]
MRQEGHTKMRNRHFFKELNKDGSGNLEFMEVMSLYYVIKSGRPFCSGCVKFIPGMYFACKKCFENGHNSFCVCPECYDDELFLHEHVQFLDNYALLEARRMQGIATYSNQHKPSSSVTITEEPTSTTNAVVLHERPKPQWRHLAPRVVEVSLNALDFALNAAKIYCTSNVCTIM